MIIDNKETATATWSFPEGYNQWPIFEDNDYLFKLNPFFLAFHQFGLLQQRSQEYFYNFEFFSWFKYEEFFFCGVEILAIVLFMLIFETSLLRKKSKKEVSEEGESLLERKSEDILSVESLFLKKGGTQIL